MIPNRTMMPQMPMKIRYRFLCLLSESMYFSKSWSIREFREGGLVAASRRRSLEGLCVPEVGPVIDATSSFVELAESRRTSGETVGKVTCALLRG